MFVNHLEYFLSQSYRLNQKQVHKCTWKRLLHTLVDPSEAVRSTKFSPGADDQRTGAAVAVAHLRAESGCDVTCERAPLQDLKVIGGDFNAPHGTREYRIENHKHNNLWSDTQQGDPTLVTGPLIPTRTGASVCVDTTPDLTFTNNIMGMQLTNTRHHVGSDRSILEITVRARPRKTKGTEPKIVNWG